MSQLTLTYNTNLEKIDLLLSIDSIVVSPIYKEGIIIIPCDLSHGFHMLEIQILNQSPDALIEFTSADLDEVSFKHTLYTMFNNAGYQTTALTPMHNTVYLPFMNPLAWWFSSCASRIPMRFYAGGLYENLKVYYPKSINLKNKYSKLVTDFFKENMDFYTHPNYSLNDAYYRADVPYVSVPDKINYDEYALLNEFLTNLEFLKSNSIDYLKRSNTKSDQSQGTQLVNVINVRQNGSVYKLDESFLLDPLKFPCLYKFFKELPIDDIAHAFIGILGPGEAVTPHIDSYVGFEFVLENYGGCSQLYIPINFKPGNYFKFANVGTIPVTGPILVNNHNFVHGLVNDSDEYRFAIGIVGSKIK